MKNLIKKNQLMITALAIMIAIAGYLQFAEAGPDDEYLAVNDGDVYAADELLDLSEEDLLASLTEIGSLDSDVDIIVDDYLDVGMDVQANTVADASETSGEGTVAEVTPDEGEIPGEAIFTSTSGVTMISEAKLLKEQTRAKNKETLLEIINSSGLSEAQKQDAVNEMVKMTAIAEKEAAAEILLEAKGYKDVVVSINGETVDVVVNASVLDDAMRAQIEDIVKRKTEIAAENIIISTVVQ